MECYTVIRGRIYINAENKVFIIISMLVKSEVVGCKEAHFVLVRPKRKAAMPASFKNKNKKKAAVFKQKKCCK